MPYPEIVVFGRRSAKLTEKPNNRMCHFTVMNRLFYLPTSKRSQVWVTHNNRTGRYVVFRRFATSTSTSMHFDDESVIKQSTCCQSSRGVDPTKYAELVK